jgi:hypothetical protein
MLFYNIRFKKGLCGTRQGYLTRYNKSVGFGGLFFGWLANRNNTLDDTIPRISNGSL